MTQTALYDELIAACSQDGCPMCRVEHAAALRHLERLFYELVNDYNTRLQLRASLGFCGEHAQMALDEIQGKALGVAIIYDDLLRVALEQLSSPQPALKPTANCPVCKTCEDSSGWAVSEFSKRKLQDELFAALASSQGLCFGHIRQLLEKIREQAKRTALINIQSQIMEKLRGELAEYIRKNDYRFAGEPFGKERDAWRRAVALGKK